VYGVIECLPFADFIARYDRPTTLFYIDPPYWGSEADYGADLFERADYARLAEQLAGIKGRFVLSINDLAATRHAFGRFKQTRVKTTYTLAGGRKAKPVAELIVTGPRAV
jgi:DNA adenine methylase